LGKPKGNGINQFEADRRQACHHLMAQGCDDAKSKDETTAATATAMGRSTPEAPIAHA